MEQWPLILIGGGTAIAFILYRNRRFGSKRLPWHPKTQRTPPREMSLAPRMWENRPIGRTRQDPQSSKKIILHVHFNFNGHSWDAFEVLGIKMGCSIEEIELALAKNLAHSAPDSHEFYNAAYSAIKRQLENVS